jgi:YD repeat-containing protein
VTLAVKRGIITPIDMVLSNLHHPPGPGRDGRGRTIPIKINLQHREAALRPASFSRRGSAALLLSRWLSNAFLAAGLLAAVGAATAGQYEGQCKQSGGTQDCNADATLDPWHCSFGALAASSTSLEACVQAVVDQMNANALPGESFGPEPGKPYCDTPQLTGLPRSTDPAWISYFYAICRASKYSNGNIVPVGSFSIANYMDAICPANSASVRGSYGPRGFVHLPPYCLGRNEPQFHAKEMGERPPLTCNPVNIATGNKFWRETDHAGGRNGVRLSRAYNSGGTPQSIRVGRNWKIGFDRRLVRDTNDFATAFRPDGQTLIFRRVAGVFQPEADGEDRLEEVLDAVGAFVGWRYRVAEGEDLERYDAEGRLTSVATRAGLATTLAYDAAGRLARVTGPDGRSLDFGYDAGGRLATVADPAGGVYAYGYDARENLVSVTYPDGRQRQYHYENGAFPHALTGISDENGVRFATYAYDAAGRAVAAEHAGGAGHTALTYTDSWYPRVTTVTDPLGTARTYESRLIQGILRNTRVSQPGGAGCGPAAESTAYDANGNAASKTDFNGRVVT